MVIMGAALGTVYGRVSFSSQATREQPLIRSLSRHALLLPASCQSKISRSAPCPVADKTSFLFPLLEFLGLPHQIPFANSNLFPSSASFHPIPIPFFSTTRPPFVPLVKFNGLQFVPIAGTITPYLEHSFSISALSPCHVSPTTPCTSRPATTRYYAADTAAPPTCPQGYPSLHLYGPS